jgi:uncharacterized protein (AIM24 family)
MEEQLLGLTLPVLSISLAPGESVVAETGEFAWMTDSIQMSTGTDGGAGGGEPVGPLRRAANSPPLLSNYTAQGSPGTVAFAAKFPGSILPVDVAADRQYVVHQRGFLAGTPGIRLSTDFQQHFPTGIFGAEGFALRRIGGAGRGWVELAGEVAEFELGADRSLRAHLGHVGMFEASVVFQVVRVPGIVNRYFGDDAHRFAVLSGPGTVWLQSMPAQTRATSLTPHLIAGNTTSTSATNTQIEATT